MSEPHLTPREQRLLAHRRAPVAPIWAEPFHEAWQANEGVPRVLRLARATRAQWAQSRPVIKDDELVLGRFGICPTVYLGFGLVVCFEAGRCRELLERHRDCPDERALLADILRTWEGRDFTSRVTEAWRQRGLDAPLPGGGQGPWPSHATQQYRLFLELGATGMRERIARGRAANPDRDAWYDGLLETAEGVCDFAQAVRASALDAAAAAPEPRRQELQDLAAILARCPERPPETFREAVQTFWLLFYLNGADSCARLDQDLGPYLERDLAAGVISADEVREVVSSLWVRFEEHRS
jgi:hypothetical protein